MACDLTVTQADACTSGIGKIQSEITLLQVIAQNLADALPGGTDTSLEAILARACTSGIGKEVNPITLQQIIAQLLCDLQ